MLCTSKSSYALWRFSRSAAWCQLGPYSPPPRMLAITCERHRVWWAWEEYDSFNKKRVDLNHLNRKTCRDGGNTFTPERYRLELNSAHTFTGRQAPSDPHTVSGVFFFFFEKTKLECGNKPPAFRQRQAHNAVRHAARSRPPRSAPGHRARTRWPGRVCMWSRVRARICSFLRRV